MTKEYLRKILSSGDKTEATIDLICEMMEDLKEKDIKEYKREIYELSEGKVLNEEKAKCIIDNMKPYGRK